MKIKKIISLILVIIIVLSTLPVISFCIGDGYANIVNHLGDAEASFLDGVGPEIKGYALDYKYFSPVKDGGSTKYPLVIWLQGRGDNAEPGDQLEGSDIVAWATDEIQQRFTCSGGAFVFVPRAPKLFGWDKSLMDPLKACIDDFIAKNKDNIDLTRIYFGGYSIGSWMSFKIAAMYPEMIAAIFVACPPWGIDNNTAKSIADIPVWIVSSKNDFFVNHYTTVTPIWKKIISKSNVPEKCRFSVLEKTTYPDGRVSPDGHRSWHALTYDGFSSQDSNYPMMSTVDGNGKTVTLTYPKGVISWMTGFTSDYDGSTDTEDESTGIFNTLSYLINKITSFLKNLFR